MSNVRSAIVIFYFNCLFHRVIVLIYILIDIFIDKYYFDTFLQLVKFNNFVGNNINLQPVGIVFAFIAAIKTS